MVRPIAHWRRFPEGALREENRMVEPTTTDLFGIICTTLFHAAARI